MNMKQLSTLADRLEDCRIRLARSRYNPDSEILTCSRCGWSARRDRWEVVVILPGRAHVPVDRAYPEERGLACRDCGTVDCYSL